MDILEYFEISSKFIMRTAINSFSAYETNLINNRELFSIDNTLKENILISFEKEFAKIDSKKISR